MAEPDFENPAPHIVGTELQMETLESLTVAVNYHRWLRALIRPHLGDDPIEIGSGLGDYAAGWLAEGLPRITVSDGDPARHQHLKNRFAGDTRVTVQRVDVFAPPQAQHSALVAVNVVEHIADDVGALSGAHRMVRPGGKVVILVPAFEFAMSRFDIAAGHERRYRCASARQAMEKAGLRPESVHYVNAPGLIAWFIGMRLMRMTPRDSAVVRLWDRYVIPAARSLETRKHPPFGQSVLAVGTVPQR